MKHFFTLCFVFLCIYCNAQEVNNSFETATPITVRSVTSDTLNANNQTHYYKTVLPADGTLKIYLQATNNSGASGNISLAGFDRRKDSGKVFEKYVSNKDLIPDDTVINDTITVYCLAADTFYFRLNCKGAWSYTLSYDMANISPNDAEPNNTFETSIAATISTTYKGHIGYINSNGQDNGDYYRTILPSRGNIKIIIEGTHTGGGFGSIQLTAFDKRKENGQLLNRYFYALGDGIALQRSNITGLPTPTFLKDSVYINCLVTDTFYLKLKSEGCFSYHLRFEYTLSQQPEPKAKIEYERLGNTVGFRAQLTNATSFVWDFGDGTGSTLKYPMKTYSPGYHVAKLIAFNKGECIYSDTARQIFEIKGVEYFTPDFSAEGGDANMQIFGGGLDTATVVKLVRGGETIIANEKYTNTLQNHLTAVFDLHFANSGTYDVVIQIPGQPAVTYPKGFVINKLIYPYTTSEVQGPSRWRTNVDTRFKLVIGNKGNVAASGVVLALVWPKDVTIKFEDKFITPPATGIETVMLPNDPQIYSLPRSETRFIYDSLETSTPIDTFAGKPYDGYIRYLLIPHIPVNSTIELPFIAKTSKVQKNTFISWTLKPNLWGSCHTGNYLNYSEDITAEIIDGADLIVDKTHIPLLKALTKTAKIGQKHAGSAASYLGKQFWGWYDGYEVDQKAAMADWLKETEANNAFAIQTATDELGVFMLKTGVGKLNSTYQKQVDFINKRFANNPTLSPALSEAYINKLNALSGANKRLNTLKTLFDETKNLGTLSDKLVKLQKMVDDCPELQKQLDDLKKQLDKELHQKDVKAKPTNSVTSLDPNEINGPIGQGVDHYVNKNDRQSFMVSFENVDTAAASAQVVVVRDTLDKTKYNLRTFEFGGISVGTKYFRVPKGRKEFVIDRSLVSAHPMRVRINARIDTATGIIFWQFTAIDPATDDVPVLDGFLPPNKNKPEGEGSVSYTVNPISSLPDGTVFTNRASIIFDQNAPILTNTWQNILDILPPSSSLFATIMQDTTIKINFTGTDANSGIGYHNLHVSTNNGPWVDFSGTSEDTLIVEGEKDSTYSFYVTTEDKVGNEETKIPHAEATITLLNPLNITLGNITALNVGDRNQIDWNTLTEDTGDYFVVERSSNGINFTPFNTIKAKGTASAYQIFDDHPTSGKNYYRLRTYDRDGKFKLSKVVSAIVNKSGMFVVEANPNPVSEILTVNIHGTIEGTATILITNVQGLQVQKTSVTGNSLFINLSQFARGIYFIKYNDSKHSEVIKVIKN